MRYTDLSIAIAHAATAHAGQEYGEGPYILHPIRVMLRVRDAGGTVEQQQAAVLHDVVEDTRYGHGDIMALFGPEVATLVDAVTHRKGEETYFEYIARMDKTPDARLIKIHDLYENMRHWPIPSQVKRYLKALRLLGEDV